MSMEVANTRDNWLINLFAVAIMIVAFFMIGVLIDFVGQNPEIVLLQGKISD